MAVAGMGEGRTGDAKRRSAGDEQWMFHSLTIVDLRRLNVR
jgi:hypothetical protein